MIFLIIKLIFSSDIIAEYKVVIEEFTSARRTFEIKELATYLEIN